MKAPAVALRAATFSACITIVALVHEAFAPRIEAATSRLARNEAALRSDEVALAQFQRLRQDRALLARRCREWLRSDSQARLLEELSTIARRRNISVISSSLRPAATDAPSASPGGRELFARTRIELTLKGTYRNLLLGVADLSQGSQIIEVGLPLLKRDGSALVAQLPVTMFEPSREASIQ